MVRSQMHDYPPNRCFNRCGLLTVYKPTIGSVQASRAHSDIWDIWQYSAAEIPVSGLLSNQKLCLEFLISADPTRCVYGTNVDKRIEM